MGRAEPSVGGRIAAIEQRLARVRADYRDGSGFFAEHSRPETAVLDATEFAPRTRALYLTFTTGADHVHDVVGRRKRTAGEDGLWWVCADLLGEEPWLFDPAELVGGDRRSDLEDRFRRIDLMDGRDPDWWYRTARVLHEEFDDDPRELLAAFDHDAERIDEAVTRRYDLPGLHRRGALPEWLGLMDRHVHALENLGAVDAPADDRIRRVLGHLLDDVDGPAEGGAVRGVWRRTCEESGLAPVALRAPLGLLAERWDPDGREYVASVRRATGP